MSEIEFITILFATFAVFWLFLWLGDLLAKSTKLFDNDFIRKLFK